MSGRARLTLFALLATLLTSGALLPLVHPATWIVQAAALAAVQSAVGAGARRIPLARPLTVAAQLVVTLLLLMLLFAGKGASTGSGPLSYLVTDFGGLYGQGMRDVGEFAMPAPLTDGIRLLLISGVLLIGLLVDMLAVTVRAAAAAGLPLLALYSVAAGLGGGGGASWLWFVLSGCGYLLLLLAESRDRLTQWGRVFGGAAPGGRPARTGLSAGSRPLAPVRTGRRIGAVALGLALAVPAALPALSSGLLDSQGGSGGGGGLGTGVAQAVNPLVALQDSLNTQDNREVLKYRTDSKELSDQYLRILSLDQFDGVKWEASARPLSDVPQRLPNPPGLSRDLLAGSAEIRTSISASGTYAQRYLPMPYPATTVDVRGRWRFEPVGRTLVGEQLGKDKYQNAQGAQYTVRSVELRPTADQLAAAPPAAPEVLGENTRLPDNLPSVVADTARKVTQGTRGDYAKAVKLQDYFAVNGGFTYDTKVASGSGSQAIAKFLADKRGFCIHFSFSMATMARSLGIPARVAVGFAPGTKQGDGSVVVTMRDAHAWPELYFEGVGWTRFEPTPQRGSAPSYTRPDTPVAQPSASAPVLPSASATDPAPAPSQSQDCPQEQRRLGECGAAAASAGGGSGGVPVGAILAWTAPAVAVALLPLVPLLWRRRVRSRRLRSGDPLEAWRELGDAAWDVGITPDEALSPRAAAARIVARGRLEGDPAEAVRRVAGAVERALYAPPSATPAAPALSPDVLAARAALLSTASRPTRLRALLAPRSAARVRWTAAARWSTLTQRATTLTHRLIPRRG
ncbi:transglutaminaseTgpA domain-containing protein [Streptomyces sp. NBC_00536]|uniref:transglutaminase family protein n=1 Tax=Streptomyces sp. NBC_00536 TaxID=2975769 RepID=UPI002E80F6EA|nr:transglutaminaseTgpA domain-containing protein [Streptomyces sp. NBC_00536]WUC78591.1 transglutaminaseTgpA domain-containing protein [Streptomyces sp. NBC_00536]